MGRLFGTDGVRGIANRELSCELAMRIGRAAATVMGDSPERRPVFLIGSDTRISSSMLSAAVAAGICSAGADVVMLGTVPTPAVAYLVKKKGADAGIMISASHNPYDYNGIKIFGGEGYKLPDELEEKVESLVLDSDGTEGDLPAADGVGTVRNNSEALQEYVDHLAASTSERFDGLKIAIDCANGSASVSAEALFTSLGAEVHMLHHSPNGININAACGSTHMESLADYVVKNGMDCGLAFDGDADRFLAVDESGALVDGDRIMAICALQLKKQGKLPYDTVVGTIMTNFGFTKFCDENGLRFIATKVGDRFVLEEMLLGGYTIGGEQSGHIIFSDYATTGDGQLTAIQLLAIMKREGKPLSELAAIMTQYPQYMVNLTVSPEGKLHFYTDPEIKRALDVARQRLGDGGRVVVRPSGTEPLIRVMAEGMDASLTREVVDQTAAVIERRLGNRN
jgi:phosphoglucosamine mutase